MKRSVFIDKLRSRLINLGLLIVATLVGILIIEIAGHFLGIGGVDFFGSNYLSDRSLFITGNSFIVDQYEALKFTPNQQIRYVTTWGKDIDFDFKFSTNNLGFVQTQNVEDYNKKYIAIVGDSFTEGHGSTPWFYNFETNLRQTLADRGRGLLNLGVSGTGFANFQKSLISVKKQGINADRAIVIFISHDLLRPYANYKKTELGYHICFFDDNAQKNVCSTLPFWWLIHDFQEPQNVIKEKANAIHTLNKIYILRNNQNEFNWWEALKSKSVIIRAISNLIGNRSKALEAELQKQTIIPEYTYKALNETIKQFGKENVLFIQIPQKEETIAGKYYQFSKQLTQKLDNSYFDGLKLCNFQTNDYHRLDPHFNETGYRKLEACIRKIAEKHSL